MNATTRKITANVKGIGPEVLTGVPVLNPGDWFGKCWLIGIGMGFDTSYFVVEADGASDAIDELADSEEFGHLIRIPQEDMGDYDVESDSPTCDFCGNDGAPCDLDHLSIDDAHRVAITYDVPGWNVMIKPAELAAVREKLDLRTECEDTVRHPGKFEGCSPWVPYYWDQYLNGFSDDDDGKTLTFDVTAEDRLIFPDLTGVDRVRLVESNDGFVCEL